MKTARGILLLMTAVAVAAAFSCKRDDDDDSPPTTVVPGGPESFAPTGSSPPVVVTFNIAFAENVTLGAMQNLAAKIETANEGLWNVTEGQIRIGRIRIFENAHPGSQSDDYNSLNLSAHDIVVWSQANFNGPGIAYVLVGAGRFGRFMGIPTDVQNTTLLHELGHFLFEMTWSVAPVLIDEYEDPPDDNACLMELEYIPLRWCWTDNHQTQPGQPHSCWSQILMDYPDFMYANTNVAPAPPPAPIVEYNNGP